MLSNETKKKICELLMTISDNERQIEIIRQILAEQKEYEPYAAFRRIDRNRKSVISIYDLQRFLEDNGVFHSEKAINAFIRKYDINQDGLLSYDEFLVSILPMDNPELRTLATQRPNYDVAEDEFLPYDVEYALVKLIDREVRFYASLDYPKFQMINRYDYNNIDAFNAIDYARTGKIDYDNLKLFFRSQSLFPYDEEIIAVLRRMDKDDDGIINFEEFLEAIEPIDITLKNVSRSSYGTFTSPIKRSSPRKIARSDQPVHKSPLRRSALLSRNHSPSLRMSAGSSSKIYSSSPRYSASPYRTTATNTSVAIINKDKIGSPTRVKSPLRKEIEEELYNQKLLKSLDKPYTKSPISPYRKSISPVEKVLSPSRLSNSESRLKTASDISTLDTYSLISTLKQFIVMDKDTELIKQDLSLRPDFNLLDFFRVFDIDGKGSISLSETEDGIKLFGILPNKQELYLLFRRLDRDTDNKLRFSDFVEAFTPKQPEYANLLNNRTPLSTDTDTDPLDLFSSDTRRIITKVFRSLLDNEGTTEHLRQSLAKKVTFNLHDAFRYLDLNENGYLTLDELKLVLEKNDYFSSEKEIKMLIERFDLNKDGRISYSEFIQEISPKT